MTPAQEKAKELVIRFSGIKDFALICVEEIINLRRQDLKNPDIDAWVVENINLNIEFQNEVKQEIEKI